MSSGPNGWNQWSKHVLKELERLNEVMERLEAKLNEVEKDLVMLKVKSGVWGLIGGAIPAVSILIMWLVKK